MNHLQKTLEKEKDNSCNPNRESMILDYVLTMLRRGDSLDTINEVVRFLRNFEVEKTKLNINPNPVNSKTVSDLMSNVTDKNTFISNQCLLDLSFNAETSNIYFIEKKDKRFIYNTQTKEVSLFDIEEEQYITLPKLYHSISELKNLLNLIF